MMLIICLFMMSVCALHALILDPEGGGQTDTSYLHLLLAEEKTLRMNLEQKVQQMEQMFQEITRRVTNLESSQCESTCGAKRVSVAFMAQLSASINNPAIGHKIVFDQIITNKGGAYNNLHGIFTAPVNGTYEFTLIASSPPDAQNHGLHLFLMKNQSQIGYIFLDTHTQYWLRRDTTAIVYLNQGDEVYVQVHDGFGNHVLGGCCFHSLLGGFLIQAD